MEEEENEKKQVRIFVGGLGEAVTTEDLRRLFESLGTVQSLETIRTKGRSLAYLDFLSDPKSLSKLFSKYNGCAWKGGKLRLEKAKEDYLTRLKKEWEEEALLSKQLPASHKEDLEEKLPNTRLVYNSDENTKLLRVFFPRFRKVKSIPFSGSGKHKYSFQNIKVPPLPVHFCDCEEHCSPFVRERSKVSLDGAAEIGGMKDEEINIMKAVMNKLLEKEKVSNTKHHEKEQDSFESPDDLRINECEVDSATDDDDLIINIETKKNKVIGSQELERIMKNQESRSNKTNTTEDKSTLQVQKRSNSNLNKVKKKKSLSKLESETPADKSKMQTLIDELGSVAHPTESEYDFGESAKASWSQKSSWRELVGKGGNTAFSASFILPKFDSDKAQQNSDDSCTPSSSTNDETENMESDGYPGSESTDTQVIEEFNSDKDPQKSDDSSTPSSTNDETEDMESGGYLGSKPTNTQVIEEPDSDDDQQKSDDSCSPSFTNDETEKFESDGDLGSKPTNTQVIEEPTEAQPTTKPVISESADTQHNVAPKKTSRGSSWLQKQSWTQLVSEQNSSFSITQILPGITFPEPKTMAPMMDPAVSNECKHVVDKNTINRAVVDGDKNTVPENGEHAGGDDIVAAPVIEKKIETSLKEKSTGDIEIGKTCSFMRSVASLKEWAKARAALSASLKRKRGEK